MWLTLGITSGVVAAIAIAIVIVPGKDELEPPKPVVPVAPAPVIGPANPHTVSSIEQSVVDSCDPTKIRNLVQLFNEEAKHFAAVRAGNAYQKKCARSPRLDWDILYAYEQMKEWREASKITDRLLREDPTDSDFWWWRGKVRRHLANHEGALVDLRQSLSQSTEHSNGVQIDHVDAVAKPLDTRCETAFGLRWLAGLGVELSTAAERQMLEVYFESDCKRLDGTGEFSWSTDALKRPKLSGAIGTSKKLVVMIDSGIGTTLVRDTVADQLALARGNEHEVMTPTGLGKGHLSSTTISIGKATAADVPVAIVDKLPEGVDVVIGLSFLWRFDVALDGETYRATPSRHE